MTNLKEIYKCNVCGNIVEVLHAGIGKLVCCGQEMSLQKENSVDASIEKHLPIIEENNLGYVVKVGAVVHPMEDAHYIEWIEAETEEGFCKKFLTPDNSPELIVNKEVKNARAYCNLHGLWKK